MTRIPAPERMSAAEYKGQGKPRKYRNEPVTVDGIRFDSKRERDRYLALKRLQDAGLISHLELQPAFKLAVGDRPVRFASGRQAVYRADFAYWDGQKRVVEDAKGFRTPEYKLKRAIVEAMHPSVRIVEV